MALIGKIAPRKRGESGRNYKRFKKSGIINLFFFNNNFPSIFSLILFFIPFLISPFLFSPVLPFFPPLIPFFFRPVY